MTLHDEDKLEEHRIGNKKDLDELEQKLRGEMSMSSKDQETMREQMRVSIKLFFRAWSRTCARNLTSSTEIRKADMKSCRIYVLEVSRDWSHPEKEYLLSQRKARRRKAQRAKAVEDRRSEQEKELKHQCTEEARRRDKETKK